jgi:hypothetical protein
LGLEKITAVLKKTDSLMEMMLRFCLEPLLAGHPDIFESFRYRDVAGTLSGGLLRDATQYIRA